MDVITVIKDEVVSFSIDTEYKITFSFVFNGINSACVLQTYLSN